MRLKERDGMPTDNDLIRRIEARLPQDRVQKLAPGMVGVFDAGLIARLNAENFRDLRFPKTLGELLAPRRTPPPAWETARAAIGRQMARLQEGSALRALVGRMERLTASTASVPTRISAPWLCHQLMVKPLIPFIIDELTPAERRAVEADVDYKLRHVLPPTASDRPNRFGRAKRLIEVRAGLAVRRALGRRSRTRAQPPEDLAAALSPLMEAFGHDRCAYVVTTLITAACGAPGCVAACTLLEVHRRPELRRTLRRELGAVTMEDLVAAAPRAAPRTYDVIREGLRLWSFPTLVTRPVLRPLQVDEVRLAPGDGYLMSSYVNHRDAAVWPRPEAFDPERWLAPQPAAARASYQPFGWSPRKCLGASVGLVQLFACLKLLLAEWELSDVDPAADILTEGISVPVRFHAVLRPGAAA